MAKTKLTNGELIKKLAKVPDSKIIIAGVKAETPRPSNWGHYVSIMPCAETRLSAKSAIETLSLDRTNIFGVCIHHTDTEDADTARKVLKSKNYSTHLLIDRNGYITVELPLDKRAAACVGFNKWMWQVDVVGRLHKNEPAKAQLLALENLLFLLACGRPIEVIDKKFAEKCRKLSSTDVQKETPKRYLETYNKYHERAVKKGTWAGILDKLPFTIIYHGEVRPTACCGKYLINKLPQIINSVCDRLNDVSGGKNE